MITPLTVLGAGLATALVVAAAPASAAPPEPAAKAVQAGYVAVPTAFHSAKVTVHVPTLPCSRTSPQRTLSSGLFASELDAGVVRPVSLTVDATCKHGAVSYRAVYGNNGGGAQRVHRGDVVILELDGVRGFSIEDRTSGEGSGGSVATGPGAKQPKAERPVLIGVQWTGKRPAGVHVDFSAPRVNHKQLATLAHHKRGNTSASRVGALRSKKFRITFLP